MFNQNGGGYSLADIAAATGNNSGFGDGNNSWWIIILFLIFFNGWGGYGAGNGVAGPYGTGINFSLGVPATQADVFNQTLISKLDNQTYGLADSTYALNNAITNGFASAQLERANDALAQANNTFAVQNAINNGVTSITSQLTNMAANDQACCCATQNMIQNSFSDLNYRMAEQSCQTRQAVKDGTASIIANQDANTRSILDFLTQDKIASLISENSALKAAANNAAQTWDIVNQLRPSPVPSYTVPNPYYSYHCGQTCTM